MKKIIFLAGILIIIQFVSCRKEINTISLYIRNKTSDTIHIHLYPIPVEIYKYPIIHNLNTDSSILLVSDVFVGSPNEIFIKNFTQMNLIFIDTSYIISNKTDTTNNPFNNNRWIFMEKNSYKLQYMFSSTEEDEYKFVFNIYEVGLKSKKN